MNGVGLRAVIGSTALAVVLCSAVRGDSVTLKDGTELECQVMGYDNGLFYVSSPDIVTNIPSSNVARIRFSPGGAGGFGQSRRGFERGGGLGAGRAGAGGTEAETKTDLKDLEWVKTALAQPKVQESNPKSIMANRIDLAGQLVKIEFPYRSEIRQQTDKIYSARVGEMGNHMIVSFGKDGLEYIQKVPDMRENKATKYFTAYGVVLSDQMKRDLFNDIYQVGDILLLGRIGKKSASGKTTYSW